jgi:V8-like Glu-specific endopeptidase
LVVLIHVKDEFILQADSRSYDYAVVTLKQENKLYPPKFIGDHVGYAGLATVSGVDDPKLDSATITGFLKGGRTMWTSGQCPSGFIEGASVGYDTNFVGFHDCDTYGGQYGSSVLGSDYLARGVHAFGLLGTIPCNCGVIFKEGNGILTTLCKNLEERSFRHLCHHHHLAFPAKT